MARKKIKSNGKKRTRKTPEPEPVYVPSLEDEVGYWFGAADEVIYQFEHNEEDDYGKVVDEKRLIERLNYIHEELGELMEDGWDGESYRDAMDAWSNKLWKLGVAWPQDLPYWSWADVVDPKDLKKEICATCLYQKDLIAIRKYADEQMWRFKDAVHFLVEHARKTLDDFSKPEPKLRKRRAKKVS